MVPPPNVAIPYIHHGFVQGMLKMNDPLLVAHPTARKWDITPVIYMG